MQNKKIALIGKWRNFVEQLKISRLFFSQKRILMLFNWFDWYNEVISSQISPKIYSSLEQSLHFSVEIIFVGKMLILICVGHKFEIAMLIASHSYRRVWLKTRLNYNFEWDKLRN